MLVHLAHDPSPSGMFFFFLLWHRQCELAEVAGCIPQTCHRLPPTPRFIPPSFRLTVLGDSFPG